MNCTKCGTAVSPDAKFCAECGSPISEAPSQKDAKAPVVPTVATKRKAVSLYILGGFLILGYAMLFTPDFLGKGISPQTSAGYIFWTGLLFYLWWKQRGRNGWHGALVGSAIALVVLFVAGFIGGVVRYGA